MTEKKLIDRAMRIRSRAKSAKPEFVRYESWRYVRLKSPWRNQRGLDNKARLKMKGWEVSPNVGFRGPRMARNLHPSGYKESIVHNLKNLEKIDPKEYAIRIAHQVGMRKRMLILGKAEELGLKVLNPVSEIMPSAGEVKPVKEEKEAKKEAVPEDKKEKREKQKKEKKQEKQGKAAEKKTSRVRKKEKK